MRDPLHERIAQALAAGPSGVLCSAVADRVWAMPVQYRSAGLTVECLLPRWSDLAAVLEERPAVVLMVLHPHGLDRGWLQMQGRAEPYDPVGWTGPVPPLPAKLRPEEIYRPIRIRPIRFDLYGDQAGWGGRETLDL